MKKNKLTIMVLAVMVILTTVLTTIHLTTRQQADENGLQIVRQGKTTVISLDDLTLTAVHGTTVNGKGEAQTVDGEGIALSDLLTHAGIALDSFTQVQVVSDDEYTAMLQHDEVCEDDKAYLLMDEESVRLIVFGDKDSKRKVKNVIRLILE